jgi:DNA-binding response OmpR family regulator
MLRIILATARPQALQGFAETLLSNPEVQLEQVDSGAAALAAARNSNPKLMIIDSGLPDTGALELVQKLVMVDAMVNTAVVSPLSDEEFHEASEGLGVLRRLPDVPGKSEATDLLRQLNMVLGGNA